MNDKRLKLLVCLGTLLVLYFLGHYSDILSVVTFHKNGSTISFIGIILWLIISSIIYYVIQDYKKKKG
jgi:hypothetical protein